MCKNHVFGSKNIFPRPNGIFLFLQNEQGKKKKKKAPLSQQLVLNYWPLSVAAAKGPLILETCDDAGRASPGGIWVQPPLCFAQRLKHAGPWLAGPLSWVLEGAMEDRHTRVSVIDPSLTSCVFLGRILNSSEPWTAQKRLKKGTVISSWSLCV